NLAARTVELEVLPACRAYGVGVIPWSPLAGGLLGGSLGSGGTGRRQKLNPRFEKLRPQVDRWERFCTELGEEPAAVALAWLIHQDGVTAPIIGPRTLEQLEGASLRASELALDDDAQRALDEIFPGPGGAAPEAYAW
ncbi:MAG: aldo/keto reductase, partial [Acidimicrobiia bacterium]